MTTKTITIMEDAYEILARKKVEGESFSDVIRRTVGKEKDIMQFAGAWKHLSRGDVEERKRRILELRKESTRTLMEKRKRLLKHDMPRF